MKCDYDTLLKRARSKLPKDVYEHVRFEIPDVVVVNEGRKTIIMNFSEIAQKLNREANHLIKFLTRELATSANQDGNRVIFQGRFISSLLNRRIDLYAKEFVICHECTRPDTHLIKEDRIMMVKCDACGARYSARAL